MRNDYEKLLNYAFYILAKKRYTSTELSKKCKQYMKRRDMHDEAIEDSAKVPSATLSGNFDPHVQASTLRSKFPCRLASDTFAESSILEKVLKRLFELKYLDDDQYAKDYIAGRLKFKPKGEYALIRELKLKGIPNELTKKILTESPIDEFEMAMNALGKKERIWDKFPVPKKKEKAYRFLSARGFSPDTIYKIVDKRYNLYTEVEF